ncbi:MAG TPA: mannose-6-phosphate isomerase, class I [Propionibacteriaceae bacterium]|nr:mannose-6-phosphate isomerase, class I [Propionibacteriaceae bacterium]
MRRIEGRAQHYAWGSPTAIPGLLGRPATGEPYAEHWLGAHESAPSLVDGAPFDKVLAEEAPSILGTATVERFGGRLPYLMKLLAADRPLSIQAHPDRAQAEAGFARENAAGVPIDAPERTYRDAWPKPEALIAVTPFVGLCGFRDPVRTVFLLEQLGVAEELGSVIAPLTHRKGSAALAQVFLDVLSVDGERLRLVDLVVDAAADHTDDDAEVGDLARAIVSLGDAYPGDRGILAAMLLNVVTLQPGEGMFLGAGNMHAYLHGVGVEVMANSDNVLRGGLTPKHIDVDELMSVVKFKAEEPTLLPVEAIGPRTYHYATSAPEFTVWRVDPGATPVHVPGCGARIGLVLDGDAQFTTSGESLHLERGEAVLLEAKDCASVSGTGLLYLSGPGI